MDDKKKVSLTVVILNCVSAVLWNICLFLNLAYGYRSVISFVLHIVCAILGDVSSVIWVIRYRKEKK